MGTKPAKARRTTSKGEPSGGLRFSIRVTREELDLWKAKAKADGRTVASWLRYLCNRASDV